MPFIARCKNSISFSLPRPPSSPTCFFIHWPAHLAHLLFVVLLLLSVVGVVRGSEVVEGVLRVRGVLVAVRCPELAAPGTVPRDARPVPSE